MDCSVNIATSLTGVLGGIIVDGALLGEAKAHGLKLLIDVRDKTQIGCLQTYRDQVWRLRMQHDPSQTKRLLSQFH